MKKMTKGFLSILNTYFLFPLKKKKKKILNLFNFFFFNLIHFFIMLLPPIDDLLRSTPVSPEFCPLVRFPTMQKVAFPQQIQVKIENVPVESENMHCKSDGNESTNNEISHKKSRCIQFTPEEETRLQQIVAMIGCYNWQAVANILGTKTARQCKEKWYGTFKSKNLNTWSIEEDILLVKQYAVFGPKWKKIAALIPGRTSNSIRNRWKTLLKNTNKHTP